MFWTFGTFGVEILSYRLKHIGRHREHPTHVGPEQPPEAALQEVEVSSYRT